MYLDKLPKDMRDNELIYTKVAIYFGKYNISNNNVTNYLLKRILEWYMIEKVNMKHSYEIKLI